MRAKTPNSRRASPAPSSMVEIKVRYLRVKASGWYWEPTPEMRRAGLEPEALGKPVTPEERAEAIARAEFLNRIWDETRAGVSRGTVVYPPKSFGAFVVELKTSPDFKLKAQRTRDEINAAMDELLPVFGAARLDRITPDHIRAYAREMDAAKLPTSRRGRLLKWLRWVFNAAMKEGKIVSNPALVVSVPKLPAREAVWAPTQVQGAVKAAWDRKMFGAAAALAIMYDTALRTSDVLALRPEQVTRDGVRTKPAKTQSTTDAKADLPLWPETLRVIARYRAAIGVELLPGAPLIRSRTGKPYQRTQFARDVRKAMTDAKLPKALQARDLRRTATTESAEGGATAPELAARNVQSIKRSAEILDTYTLKTRRLAEAAQARRRRAKLKV